MKITKVNYCCLLFTLLAVCFEQLNYNWRGLVVNASTKVEQHHVGGGNAGVGSSSNTGHLPHTAGEVEVRFFRSNYVKLNERTICINFFLV